MVQLTVGRDSRKDTLPGEINDEPCKSCSGLLNSRSNINMCKGFIFLFYFLNNYFFFFNLKIYYLRRALVLCTN